MTAPLIGTRRAIFRRISSAIAPVFVLAMAMVATSTVPAFAHPGDLDTTFGGGDGIATAADFGGTARAGTDTAVQPDGKILVVGSRGKVSGNMAVWRLTADGLPDTTFSGDGIAVIDFGGNEIADELALLSDGRIAVVGTSTDTSGQRHLALALLTPSGRLDTRFSGDGLVLRGGTGETWGYGVAVDASDDIVVVGGSRAGAFTVFRYLPTGAPDKTLGGNGFVDLPGLSANISSGFPEPVDVAIQPDGKIVALGLHFVPPPAGQPDCGVARIMPDGSPDTSFSGDGVAYAGFSQSAECSGLVVSPVNGKITVAGTIEASPMAMARFTTGGALDPNFGVGGRVITSLGVSDARGYGVGLEGTKTILVGGATVNGDSAFAIARFTARGQLDTTTFGDAGRVFLNVVTSCCTVEAATTATIVGGKLVVGGEDGTFAVARFAAGDV